MRTVHYSEVLCGSAAMAGMGMQDIGSAEFALLRSFHDQRLQSAWELHRWPELCRVEQRWFRAKWVSGVVYGAGDERFDVASGRYFQSLADGNGNAPTVAGVENSAFWAECATGYSAGDWASNTVYAVGMKVRNPEDWGYYQCTAAHTSGSSFDAANWGALVPFDRYVSLDQVEDDGAVLTPIGEIFEACDANPRLTTKLVRYPFWLSENGAQFTTLKHAISMAWLMFRVRRPVLSGEAWEADREYVAGDQVFYVTSGGLGNGDFYTANAATVAGEGPESAPEKWVVVPIPYIFRLWLVRGGYADWLAADGQAEKAGAAEGAAWMQFELETDKLQRQQGQVRRLQWG